MATMMSFRRPALSTVDVAVDRPVVVLARRRDDEWEVEFAVHRTWELAEAVAARIARAELADRLGADPVAELARRGALAVLAEYNLRADGEAFIAVVPAFATAT